MNKPDSSSNPAESAKVPPGSVSGDPAAGVPAGGASYVAATPSASAGAMSQAERAGISPESAEKLESLAADLVDAIVEAEPGSGELARAIAAVDRLGERDFVATAAMSGRVLDRRFRSMDSLLGSKAPMARQLLDLRRAAGEIDPARLKLGGKRSPEEEIHELDRYFERFLRTQPRLQEILDGLNQGRLVLEQDNASIVGEETSLSAEIETLRQYAFLTTRMDELLTARIGAVETGDAGRAEVLRADCLTPVRRRRQEILTQLAISLQGFEALRIVEENNEEVIRAVASAISTTAAAMRTAVMTAQAAASQRISLSHLQAAQRAASAMADQTAALESSAAGPGGRVAVLRDAWAEVYAALDRVEARKAQVLRTIAQADRELTKPKPGAR